MPNFYINVEQEIKDFIHRCHDFSNTFNTSSIESSIPCLTEISYDIFSLAIEQLNIFINYLSSYTSDMSIEYDNIISIISNCSDLTNYINTYQYLFIEYAIDDYLLLDEHLNIIYEKIFEILNYLYNLPSIDTNIYNLEKQLIFYLPINYLKQLKGSLSKQILSTFIEQNSQLFSSSYNLLLNDNNEDNNDCIISSTYLFSSTPISINFHHDHSKSLLQLDKINIHTTFLTYPQIIPSFQYDLIHFEQIENDLIEQNDWIKIEREFFLNIISIWSKENISIQTINPWSSETFWTLFMNFKYPDINLKNKFFLIIQWCFSLLTIQAFNRDWDLFYSKTLINAIITNRWRIVCFSPNIHLSIVGHNINQMFLRLIRITIVLQYMKILSDQSSYLTSFFINIITSYTNNLIQQIEKTFHLLIIWLTQHADTFINGNSLERTLIICKSDQIQLSISINNLIDNIKQLNNCEELIKLIDKLHLSSQTIVNETMLKLYRRIQINTTNHFDSILPLTSNEWRTTNQQTSYMIIACDKLLKPIISQYECINMDNKFDIYERILSSFTQAWTSILLERKYHFSDEMINFLQKDYEYLQIFLSTNICDQDIVELLNQSLPIQQISTIINLLKTGEKHRSDSSISHIPNHDKWLRSRNSSSLFLECFQYTFCCQRRNRVTTDPT